MYMHPVLVIFFLCVITKCWIKIIVFNYSITVNVCMYSHSKLCKEVDMRSCLATIINVYSTIELLYYNIQSPLVDAESNKSLK